MDKTKDSVNTPRVAPAGAVSGDRPKNFTDFTDQEKSDARANIQEALVIAGLVSGGHPMCPNRCEFKKGRLKVYGDGGLKCHKCGFYSDSIGILRNVAGYSFRDAVNTLLGRPLDGGTSAPKRKPKLVGPLPAITPSFTAAVDTDVMHFIRDASSSHWAEQCYARWHIGGAAVAEADCRVIEAPEKLQRMLLNEFSPDRVIAAGLALRPEWDERKLVWMFSAAYPVIEPHRLPNGDWVGLQFRASRATEQLIRSYPAAKNAYDAAQAEGNTAVQKPRYVPKFMSLKGGAVGKHLVGMGLPAIADSDTGQKVYFVEGMKDLLAMRTFGFLAYAIPGAGHLPPDVAMELFRQKQIVPIACADGDDAGRAAQDALVKHFEAAGFKNTKRKDIPDGHDVTDMLIKRHADSGCECTACDSYRGDSVPVNH